MITVTCPNCNVENSALSRRCISCGSDLILEGYVRCENCRALTPTNLEFCELCGSFLASIPEIADKGTPDVVRKDAGRPAMARAEPSLTIEPPDETELPDDRIEKTDEAEEGRSNEGHDESTGPLEATIPGWLLDVDAALKVSRTSDKYDSDAVSPAGYDAAHRGADQSGISGLHDETVRRMDTSDLPEQPTDSTDSLDWLSVIEGLTDASDTGIGEDDSLRSHSGSETDDSGLNTAVNRVQHADDEAPEGGQIPRRRRMGTQPLDAEGKLLGVPQQLAGTDLPAWLSDQLQRPDDSEATEITADIDLPEPTRATYIKPKQPVTEHQEPPVEDSVLDPSFEKWLKQLSDDPVTPDWMDEGEEQLEGPLVSDSVQAGAETPRWLHDVHQEQGDTAELLGIEESIAAEGRLAGLKGAIQIEPVIATVLVTSPNKEYTVSKEQRQQIAILEGVLHAEPVTEKQKTVEQSRGTTLRLRVLLAGALVLLIMIGIVVPSSTEWLQGTASQPASEEAQQLYDQLRLAAGTPVLVAFDYTPALAGELNPIANILLAQLAENESTAITVSQSAAGSEVAVIIAQDVDGLEWQQLGFIPGEAVGLRSLAECLKESGGCKTIFGKALPSEAQQILADVTLILILTGDSDSLIAWIEQVGAQLENVALLAGVTQALGPVVLPYFASGQLEGVLDGFPDAIVYQRDLLEVESDNSENVSALTLAIWFVAGILLAGTIYYALTGLNLSRRG